MHIRSPPPQLPVGGSPQARRAVLDCRPGSTLEILVQYRCLGEATSRRQQIGPQTMQPSQLMDPQSVVKEDEHRRGRRKRAGSEPRTRDSSYLFVRPVDLLDDLVDASRFSVTVATTTSTTPRVDGLHAGGTQQPAGRFAHVFVVIVGLPRRPQVPSFVPVLPAAGTRPRSPSRCPAPHCRAPAARVAHTRRSTGSSPAGYC